MSSELEALHRLAARGAPGNPLRSSTRAMRASKSVVPSRLALKSFREGPVVAVAAGVPLEGCHLLDGVWECCFFSCAAVLWSFCASMRLLGAFAGSRRALLRPAGLITKQLCQPEAKTNNCKTRRRRVRRTLRPVSTLTARRTSRALV